MHCRAQPGTGAPVRSRACSRGSKPAGGTGRPRSRPRSNPASTECPSTSLVTAHSTAGSHETRACQWVAFGQGRTPASMGGNNAVIVSRRHYIGLHECSPQSSGCRRSPRPWVCQASGRTRWRASPPDSRRCSRRVAAGRAVPCTGHQSSHRSRTVSADACARASAQSTGRVGDPSRQGWGAETTRTQTTERVSRHLMGNPGTGRACDMLCRGPRPANC